MGIGYRCWFSHFFILGGSRKWEKVEAWGSDLKLIDKANVAAKAIGSTSIDLYDHDLLLDDVLNVPNAYENIISISSLTRKNYVFHFEIMFGTYFGNEINGMGYLIQGLYYVDNISNNNMPQTFMSKVNALFKEIASNSKKDH